jgi:hypothetical protein
MYPRAVSAIPIDLKHPYRYQRVRLTLEGARQVRLADTGTPQGSWHNAFMNCLAGVSFQGEIEWTHNIDDATHCIALHSLTHANDAVLLLTTFALELNHLVGWFDGFEQCYGETVAQTILRDAYLKDCNFPVEGYVAPWKRGWSLVLANIDTSLIDGVRNQLPTTVAQYNHPSMLEGQAV